MKNDTCQRDWITEAGDSPMLKSLSMKTIIDRIPIKDMLSVADVSSALYDLHPSVVYAWIDEGKFEVMDLGGKGRPLYKINRLSFLAFMETRVK